VPEVYDSVIMVEYESIREQLGPQDDQVIAFLEYFERTWIGRRLGMTRRKALFPPSSWNHYTSILTGKRYSDCWNMP
jgi:hypothetical protein